MLDEEEPILPLRRPGVRPPPPPPARGSNGGDKNSTAEDETLNESRNLPPSMDEEAESSVLVSWLST